MFGQFLNEMDLAIEVQYLRCQRPVFRITVGEMGSMTLLVASPSAADAKAIDDAIAAHLREQLLSRRQGVAPARPRRVTQSSPS